MISNKAQSAWLAILFGGLWTSVVWVVAWFDQLEDIVSILLAPGSIIALIFMPSGVHTSGIGRYYGFTAIGFNWLFYSAIAYVVLRIRRGRGETQRHVHRADSDV